MTLVESYLVVSVGYLFLGFGGSRWTAPYTERYIGLAVSIGIKLILLLPRSFSTPEAFQAVVLVIFTIQRNVSPNPAYTELTY